jgi:hypothetical protein
MPTILALSCPVCGAPLKPGDEKCHFCGAYILIKSDLPRLDRRTLNQSVIHEHIADFRQRVRKNRFDEEAHYGLGVAYFNLGLIEESIDELSHAAKLMPENPHIQAQMAVVYREKLRAGDKSAFAKMEQRMQVALRLDPEQLDALSLQASIYAAADDNVRAETIIARIEDISPEKARQVRESILIRRIEKRMVKEGWSSTVKSLDVLALTNEAEAKRLAASYLVRHRSLFPLKLAKPSLAGKRGNWLMGAFLLSIFLVGFLNVVVVTFGASVPGVVNLVLFTLVFISFSLKVLARHQDEVNEKSVLITEDKVTAEHTPYAELRRLGNAFTAYQQGALKTYK